jgi:hypothetical protein
MTGKWDAEDELAAAFFFARWRVGASVKLHGCLWRNTRDVLFQKTGAFG